MATDKPRLSVTVPDALYDEIRRYQEEYNFTTNSRAVLDLIKKGIADIKEETPLSDEAVEIARKYEWLSNRDKTTVSGLINSLIANSPKNKKPPSI